MDTSSYDNHNHYPMTEKDLSRAYGALLRDILCHLALLWENNRVSLGECSLLEQFGKNIDRALLSDILAHLALLWGTNSVPLGDFALLDFFQKNIEDEDSDVLSDASKDFCKLILNAANLSVKAMVAEVRAGGVEGLN